MFLLNILILSAYSSCTTFHSPSFHIYFMWWNCVKGPFSLFKAGEMLFVLLPKILKALKIHFSILLWKMESYMKI